MPFDAFAVDYSAALHTCDYLMKEHHELWAGHAHTLFQQILTRWLSSTANTEMYVSTIGKQLRSHLVWYHWSNSTRWVLHHARIHSLHKGEGKEEQVSFSYTSVEFVKIRRVSTSMTNMAKFVLKREKRTTLEKRKIKWSFGSGKKKKIMSSSNKKSRKK